MTARASEVKIIGMAAARTDALPLLPIPPRPARRGEVRQKRTREEMLSWDGKCIFERMVLLVVVTAYERLVMSVVLLVGGMNYMIFYEMK